MKKEIRAESKRKKDNKGRCKVKEIKKENWRKEKKNQCKSEE